jgi:hypothetical protein
LQEISQNSPKKRQQAMLTQMAQAARSPLQGKAVAARMNGPVLQKNEDENAEETVSASEQSDDGEAPLQAKSSQLSPVQRIVQAAGKANNSGLPDDLKSGIESLSGMRMDHVTVNYNSPQPAQLNAHAYAQGSEIHVAPGQEKHLPHEAWHVVQQAQGRVKPTMQMKTGVPVNDDVGLEHEADVMGAKALGAGTAQLATTKWNGEDAPASSPYFSYPAGQMKRRDATMQLAPLEPENTLRTEKTAEDPDSWNGKNAFSLISSNAATYPTAVRTKTRDAKGGDSDTSGLQPDGMEKWYQKGLLQDPGIPGKAQALTKMHAINSHLYGPNHVANIFLGSANANAQHSDEVEAPIKRYVAKHSRAVDYHVAITYGNPGWVNGTDYAALTGTEQKEFDTWQSQAIANQVTCTATYYEKKGGAWMASAPESHVINALMTTHKKIGGYGRPKKITELLATRRKLAKLRRSPLYGAVTKALRSKKGGHNIKGTIKYIGDKKLGNWKDKGIANMLEYMRNRGLVAIIDSKYVASKKL